ncbi:MAG: PKD domain-containing protein, partial [Flavobacterium sp.]|nr:PKD domain-containing protein [Flavobacterium sp.]
MGNVAPDKPFYSCSNQIINFVNTSTKNNGPDLVSYLWSFGDGTYSSEFEPNHIYTSNGSYTITLTVYNSCYCSSIFKTTIKIGNPGFDINCPSVVCEGQNTNYTIPDSGASACGTKYNWLIDGGHINSQSNSNANVTWDNVNETGFGYLTYDTTQCNLPCATPTTIKVPVIKKTGTIIGSSSICVGSQARYKLPQWPSTDFQWEIVGNVVNNLGEIVITDQRNEVIVKPNIAGTIVLKATYQNTLLHCGGSATFNITTINDFEIVGIDKICQNSTNSYTLTNAANTDWILKNENGIIITTVSSANTFTYNFAQPGVYKLSVAGSAQCASIPKTITVIGVPATPVAVNGDLIVCPNAPYTYSITGNNGSNRYRWEVSNGAFVGSNLGNQVVINFNNNATHEIKVYNESLNPLVCTSAPLTINVNNVQINAELSNANLSVCANSSNNSYQVNQFQSTSLYTEGEVYTWSISPASAGSITSGQSSNNINVLWNNVTGTIPVNATVTLSIKKCTLPNKILTRSVTIKPLPVLTVSSTVNNVPSTTVCSGSPIKFTVTPNIPLDDPTNVSVKWNFGNGSSVTSSGTTYTATLTNSSNVAFLNYNVSASIVSPNGCLGTSTSLPILIKVNPAPVATLSITSGGNAFCPPTSTINTLLTAATSGVGTTIAWYKDNGTQVLGTGAQLQLNQTMGYGNYYFIATNTTGCSSRSNGVDIFELCAVPVECILNPIPQVVNNSTSGCTNNPPTTVAEDCNCSRINFSGTAPGASSTFWEILGPFVNTTVSGTSFVISKAGEYHTFFNALYTCANNGDGALFKIRKTITVPYVADFGYTAQCNGNSTFTIAVTDKSSFLETVTGPTFQYAYKLNNSSTWINSITTSNGTITPDLPPGIYNIRLNIQGYLNGVLQTICAKKIDITIAAVPNQSIAIFKAATCNYDSVTFRVTGAQPNDTFLWTFEPGTPNEATSTLKETDRTFSSSGNKSVTCLVTNKYGCNRLLTLNNVNVPAPCFNGDT